MKPIDSELLPKLSCSSEFREAPLELIFQICNGCGTHEAKIDFVPDHVLFLPIYMACYIHDWDYYYGRTEQDRLDADLRFLSNMLTIIELKSVWFLKRPRRYLAYNYYNAVRDLGKKAFSVGKPTQTQR